MFGGRGITWIKVRLQVREAVGKVTEGVQFFTRGIRLLGSDCNNCGRLFYRAALGELLSKSAFGPYVCPCLIDLCSLGIKLTGYHVLDTSSMIS